MAVKPVSNMQDVTHTLTDLYLTIRPALDRADGGSCFRGSFSFRIVDTNFPGMGHQVDEGFWYCNSGKYKTRVPLHAFDAQQHQVYWIVSGYHLSGKRNRIAWILSLSKAYDKLHNDTRTRLCGNLPPR